jgi:type IV pilus assembly protein PilY1
MNLMAYGYTSDEYYHPDDFDPDAAYYGYFDPASQYTYTTNEFDRDPNGNWDGNFLNWLTMRRVDVARKVLVGGLASSRTGGGNTKLIGETPTQESRKYFKFYDHSGDHTPYSNNHLYKLSKGKVEVYSIDTPANFDFSADYKMYCNSYNGHDALFEDMAFWYNGNSNQDGQSYTIYPKSGGSGGCNYNLYNSESPLTGLTYVTSYVIKVDKVEAEEPESFMDGKIAGVIQRVGERARFGLEFFNNDGSKYETGWGKDGGYISSYIGGNLTSMITNIENNGSDTWTPLAESLYEGVRYYRQDAPYYHNGNYAVNQNLDPFYYQDEGQYVGCGKNFILLITDGESTMDANIPLAYQNYDGDNNDPGSYSNSGSDYLDDVALWAHTNDMRTGVKDIPDMQEISLYTVFAFGSGSQLLMDAAKNGGFIDRDGDSKPDTVGDARGGEWSDLGNNLEWDKDGDGVPDTYFDAPTGNELEEKIMTAINGILQQSVSGTAVSILSTSSEGEGSLFQAFFEPAVFDNLREVNWVGYLNALWIDPYGNLREDTVDDDAMVYNEDKIIRFAIDEESGNTTVKRYHDSDGDGAADSDTPYETALLSELDPQWEAGKKLALRDASSRTIKTWVDLNGNSAVDPGEFIDFDTTNAGTLRPFLNVPTEEEASAIISFIRGELVTGYRDRNITVNGTEYVWKLGDIVYSTPTVVAEPMEKYNQYYSDITYAQFFTKWKDRGATVYVGANDGMLHAFKAGTFNEGDNPATVGKEEHGWYSTTEDPTTSEALGDERWAYIPYNLLPHLKWLTDPDYTHVYYVDLKPKVSDVRIFSSDADHPNGWGTIMIGGMRLGGGEYAFTEDFDNNPDTPDEQRTFRSAYFALDITVPNSPVLLSEVTDTNLGFSTSYPAIVRLESTEGFQNPEDDKWFYVVGSGPTDCDGSSNQNGYVFVIDVSTGQVVKTFTTSENSAFMATPITLDLNLNYNVEGIYIGETYEQGANVRGKMYRISTRNNSDPATWAYQTNPVNWTMSTFFSSTTPVTASGTATIDEHDNIWIYFGTGKYYNNADKADTTAQYFYGIKEPCPYGDCDASDEVALAALFNSSNIVVLTNGEVEGAGATTWEALVDEVQAEEGWYINLDSAGERVLTRPSILGGVVLFSPFTPDSAICGYSGSGSLYGLYYETGTAYYDGIMGTENYGDNKKSAKRIALDKGVTSNIGLHVGKRSKCTGFIQQGTGSVTQIDIKPALSIKSGIIGWHQR